MTEPRMMLFYGGCLHLQLRTTDEHYQVKVGRLGYSCFPLREGEHPPFLSTVTDIYRIEQISIPDLYCHKIYEVAVFETINEQDPVHQSEISRLLLANTYKTVWKPSLKWKFVRFDESDEKWMRPLGLGKMERVQILPFMQNMKMPWDTPSIRNASSLIRQNWI